MNWELLSQSLPPTSIPERVFSHLPDDVLASIDASSKNLETLPDIGVSRWCLCTMPEGEYPRVHAFKTLDSLVRDIAKREGQDIAVWPLYGVPLRLSQLLPNGKRYMFLPDGVAVEISESGDLEPISQDSLPEDIPLQEEGWLGDLAAVQSRNYYTSNFEVTNTKIDSQLEIDNGEDDYPDVTVE